MQSWTKYYFFQRVSQVLKPREFFRSSSVKGHPLLGYPAPVLGDMHGTLHGLIWSFRSLMPRNWFLLIESPHRIPDKPLINNRLVVKV